MSSPQQYGPTSGGQVTHEDLVTHVVSLGDQVRQLQLDKATLDAQVTELKNRLAQQPRPDNRKSVLRDVQKLYPETFNPKTDSFTTWAEEFERWISAEEANLEPLLKAAASSKEEQVMPMGDDVKRDIRFMWMHLKKLMGDKESKNMVRTVPRENALEAWRLLHRRYAPKTAAVRSNRLRTIMNYPEAHANSKSSVVAQVIADYEELNRKFFEEYSSHAITNEMSKDTLMRIIPRDVENAINLAHIGKNPEDLSYDKLKQMIVEHVSVDLPAPMDVGMVQAERQQEEQYPHNAQEEEVNSLGSGAKGPGKGKAGGWSSTGKGGKAPGKGAKQPDGSCRICWRFGHFARNCPERTPEQIAAQKKRDDEKGAKGNGKKGGKGKGKKGKQWVNEVADEENWGDEFTEEEWQEYLAVEEPCGGIDEVTLDNFGVNAVDLVEIGRVFPNSCTGLCCALPAAGNIFEYGPVPRVETPRDGISGLADESEDSDGDYECEICQLSDEETPEDGPTIGSTEASSHRADEAGRAETHEQQQPEQARRSQNVPDYTQNPEIKISERILGSGRVREWRVRTGLTSTTTMTTTTMTTTDVTHSCDTNPGHSAAKELAALCDCSEPRPRDLTEEPRAVVTEPEVKAGRVHGTHTFESSAPGGLYRATSEIPTGQERPTCDRVSGHPRGEDECSSQSAKNFIGDDEAYDAQWTEETWKEQMEASQRCRCPTNTEIWCSSLNCRNRAIPLRSYALRTNYEPNDNIEFEDEQVFESVDAVTYDEDYDSDDDVPQTLSMWRMKGESPPGLTKVWTSPTEKDPWQGNNQDPWKTPAASARSTPAVNPEEDFIEKFKRKAMSPPVPRVMTLSPATPTDGAMGVSPIDSERGKLVIMDPPKHVLDSIKFIDDFKSKVTMMGMSRSEPKPMDKDDNEVIEFEVQNFKSDRKSKMEPQALRVARRIFEEYQESPQSERSESHESPKEKMMAKIIRQLKRELMKADARGEDLEVWLKSVPRTEGSHERFDDVDGVIEHIKQGMKSGSKPVTVPKVEPPRGYRRLRHGITMDSGSNVDIAPSNENPEFPVTEPTGPRRGKRLAAANGSPIRIDGEKCIEFMTKEGHQLAWPFLAGNVKKGLKSVGTTCDAGNYVLFTEWGGYIINDKTHKHIEFDRVGNVYAIDAWVKDDSQGFTRPAGRP